MQELSVASRLYVRQREMEDKETCRFFHERLERILRCRLVSAMKAKKMMVEIWERPNGRLGVVLPEIVEDDLDAFLLNFRLILQDNDRISIRRVSRAIEALPLTVKTKEAFRRIRCEFNEYLNAMPEVQIRGGPSDRRTLINTLLYGVYAHLDEREAIEAAHWERELNEQNVGLLFVTTLEGVVGFLSEFEVLMRKVGVELRFA